MIIRLSGKKKALNKQNMFPVRFFQKKKKKEEEEEEQKINLNMTWKNDEDFLNHGRKAL